MHPRLFAWLAALASLALGGGVGFAAMVADDAASTPGAMGGPYGGYVLLVFGVLTPAAFSFCVGLATAPHRVREAGLHRRFAAAVMLVALALICFATVWLFIVTWPIGALLLAVAVHLFRTALRRPASARG